MLAELQQPAYQHVLINHWPIIGTAAGVLGLAVGLLMRNRAALAAPLVILFFSGLSAWPVYVTGSAAYRPIHKIADEAGVDWLDEHMDRADHTVWAFYVMAGLASAALVVTLRSKWAKISLPLAVVTLFAGIACVAVGAYIASPAGKIRHTEFRPVNTLSPSEQSGSSTK